MKFGHVLNPAILPRIGAVMVAQVPVAGAAMPETATNVFECSAAPTAKCLIDKLSLPSWRD